MSTIVARQQFSLKVTETEDSTEQPLGTDRTRSYNSSSRKKLSAGSDADAPGSLALATRYTGSQNLDLTDFTGTLGAGQDATGLRVNGILLVNNSTTNDVTITGGVANEYELNGGNDKVVKPGCSYQEFFNDKLDEVAAGVKAISIAATAGQTFDLILVIG